MSYIGFPVPVGWIDGGQMQALADAVEAVGGDVRLTRQQNFIVGNVPNERIDDLLQLVEQIGFSQKTSRLYGHAIGCTGEPFCNYSVTQTKHKLREILGTLENRFGDRIQHLRIHLDGCPHACAQHFIGDINLMGTTVRLPDRRKMEGYDLLLRGGLDGEASIARPVIRRVRSDQVTEHLERLIAAWLDACDQLDSEEADVLSFRRFCDERSDEQLQNIATGDSEAAAS